MTTNVNVAPARDLTRPGRPSPASSRARGRRAAINDLKDAGFRPTTSAWPCATAPRRASWPRTPAPRPPRAPPPGRWAGRLLGGLVGFLVGIGALAIPGIGPVVAGGALATAFGLGGGTAVAGAGIGAAAGGIAGALVGMGIPDEEAKRFKAGFREGGVLMTVNARRPGDGCPGHPGAERRGPGPGQSEAPGGGGGAGGGHGRRRARRGPPPARRPGRRSPAPWAPSSAAPPAGSRAPRPGRARGRGVDDGRQRQPRPASAGVAARRPPRCAAAGVGRQPEALVVQDDPGGPPGWRWSWPRAATPAPRPARPWGRRGRKAGRVTEDPPRVSPGRARAGGRRSDRGRPM